MERLALKRTNLFRSKPGRENRQSGMIGLCCSLVLFTFIIFHLLSPLAWCAKAEIYNFRVSNQRDYIYINAKLKGAFTEEIKEAIASGIPTTFRYYLELYQPQILGLPNTVKKRLIQHKVEYDTLKKEYKITLDDGNSRQVKVTGSEQEMKKWMTTIESYRFFFFPSKPRGERFRIRLKAEMKCIKLPFPFNYLLFYISFWDFDTPWVSSSLPSNRN